MPNKETQRQVHAWLAVELVEEIDKLAASELRSRANMIEVLLTESTQRRAELSQA